jgi:large subunit ribosomal protein L7/L12
MTRLLALMCLLPLAAAAEPGFSVSITSIGPNKIPVIKEVRTATGWGLKEAKEKVEGPLPLLLKTGLGRVDADRISRALLDVGAGVSVAPDANQSAPPAEPSHFAVKLESFGDSKIMCIKVVRDATGLGLADTKRLVESAPVVVKDKLTRLQAELLVKDLVGAGGKASLVAP